MIRQILAGLAAFTVLTFGWGASTIGVALLSGAPEAKKTLVR